MDVDIRSARAKLIGRTVDDGQSQVMHGNDKEMRLSHEQSNTFNCNLESGNAGLGRIGAGRCRRPTGTTLKP